MNWKQELKEEHLLAIESVNKLLQERLNYSKQEATTAINNQFEATLNQETMEYIEDHLDFMFCHDHPWVIALRINYINRNISDIEYYDYIAKNT